MLRHRRASGRELTGLVQDLARLAQFGGRFHDLRAGCCESAQVVRGRTRRICACSADLEYLLWGPPVVEMAHIEMAHILAPDVRRLPHGGVGHGQRLDDGSAPAQPQWSSPSSAAWPDVRSPRMSGTSSRHASCLASAAMNVALNLRQCLPQIVPLDKSPSRTVQQTSPGFGPRRRLALRRHL
jgi:hypothetical protein